MEGSKLGTKDGQAASGVWRLTMREMGFEKQRAAPVGRGRFATGVGANAMSDEAEAEVSGMDG